MSQRKSFFKEWLEKLQQESWQLELIISGVAILGLREAIRYLDEYLSVWENVDMDGYIIIFTMLIVVLVIGAYVSLINLVIHVLARSLWIGAIGLRYVSGDIEYDNLRYNSKFTEYFKKRIGSFDRYIEKLENFSSVIFSFTFLSIFIIFSLFFYIFLFVGGMFIIQEWLSHGGIVYRIVTIIYIIIGFVGALLVAFDFISLGLLKKIKNKYFSTIYFWIYRFYSTITLSFLWRPMLFNFLDQRYTKRLFILAVPYLFILFLAGTLTYIPDGLYPDFSEIDSETQFSKQINAQSFNFQFYDDERAKRDLEVVTYYNINSFSLPSNKVKGVLGEIFIKGIHGDTHLIELVDSSLVFFKEKGVGFISEFSDNIFYNKQLEKQFEERRLHIRDSIDNFSGWMRIRDSVRTVFDKERQQWAAQNIKDLKQILQESVLLSIDDHPIPPSQISCDFYNHPIGNTKGLLCFFPLDSLAIGRHLLKVGKVSGLKVEYPKDSSAIHLDTSYQQVPFIYLGRQLD